MRNETDTQQQSQGFFQSQGAGIEARAAHEVLG
jgi:hypothetical protein